MPVQFEPPDVGCNPLEATSADASVGMLDRLLAMNNVDHQGPRMKAIFCRYMANEFTGVVGYCYRKLEISPWGDEERAALAADPLTASLLEKPEAT
jgi:hypothetical protein